MIASRLRAAGICVALVATVLSPSRTIARPVPDVSGRGELAACIRRASGGRPWLEKTLWGLRDQEAGWIGAEIPNADGSFDLGPLQINSWWVARIAAETHRSPLLVRWWLVHDPCFNVDAARWIFLSGLARSDGYWGAVGAYHSPTAWRARLYASKVAARLQGRFGLGAFSARAPSQ